MALFSIVTDTDVPQPLAGALGSVQALFKTHSNNQDRLLSNLVESQGQRAASRTITDPIFLAQEFARASFNPAHVKGFVKLYRQRTMCNQSLTMPQKVEDAVVRLMSPEKKSKTCMFSLVDFIAMYRLDNGPLADLRSGTICWSRRLVANLSLCRFLARHTTSPSLS